MIAHYMSGDRNTLASALALSKNLLVLVVGPKDLSTEELFNYFQSKIGKRALLMITASRQDAEMTLGLTKRPELHLIELRKIAATLNLGDGIVNFHAPSYATTQVGAEFPRGHGRARPALIDFWSMKKDEPRFAEFLQELGFKHNQNYAFLWCKKGSLKGEKAHHYTDPQSWHLLAQGIALGHTFIPVFTGDDIGLHSEPSLTRFWKTWERMYGEPMTRDQQLAMWAFIVKVMGQNCCAIGMRSGMLEVPALLGIRTLYLEEVENEQRTRMAKWLGLVDTWFRGVMFRPLGTMQNVYWTGLMVEHNSYPGVRGTLGKTAARMKWEATSETRFLVCMALRHVRRKSPQAYGVARDLVLEFLGYDVAKDDGDMLAEQAAIGTIVGWVHREPLNGLTGEALAKQVIEAVIPLAIEGCVAPVEKKVSKAPSPEELEQLRQKKAEAKAKKQLDPPSGNGGSQGGSGRGSPPTQMKRIAHPPPPTKFGPQH